MSEDGVTKHEKDSFPVPSDHALLVQVYVIAFHKSLGALLHQRRHVYRTGAPANYLPTSESLNLVAKSLKLVDLSVQKQLLDNLRYQINIPHFVLWLITG